MRSSFNRSPRARVQHDARSDRAQLVTLAIIILCALGAVAIAFDGVAP
ncbi:hypothetical protein [Alsobacter sp. SYSU BS001988]